MDGAAMAAMAKAAATTMKHESPVMRDAVAMQDADKVAERVVVAAKRVVAAKVATARAAMAAMAKAMMVGVIERLSATVRSWRPRQSLLPAANCRRAQRA